MKNKNLSVDQGKNFGTWQDPTSKMLYETSTIAILKHHMPQGRVADYGGGNGLLKRFIPGIISIDNDASKDPDIVADILTHKGDYDEVVLRYVLHYLNDYEVLSLFETITAKTILVIQFVNHDLRTKYKNSLNEFKYFRTKEQLAALLPEPKKLIYLASYKVGREFYLNRLGIKDAIPHYETVYAYLIDNS